VVRLHAKPLGQPGHRVVVPKVRVSNSADRVRCTHLELCCW
jgi:hypothetical protein